MRFRIQFGAKHYELEEGSNLFCAKLPLTHLGGVGYEDLGALENAKLLKEENHYYLRNDSHQFGIIHDLAPQDLEKTSEALYAQILNSLGEFRPVRIWNYVPRINMARKGLESYRAFCIGRAFAFDNMFQLHGWPRTYPAASAVGSGGDGLFIYYFASKHSVEYFENFRQVPAYEYPREYGPRSPSFSRASVLHLDDSESEIYISGTAAVVGHSSEGDTLAEQLRITIENLKLIYESCHAGASSASVSKPYVKIYLRDKSHLSSLMEALTQHEAFNHSTYTVLKADICRQELDVEIEVSIRK